MQIKRKSLIIANWKANPDSLKISKNIFLATKKAAQKYRNCEVIICPPAIYLESLKNSTGSITLGAQDLFWEGDGAFTGFVSGEQIYNAGARFAIIGHSERRALGEDNAMVAKKLLAALANGITPILCVGEKSRDTGMEYLNFIKEQLVEAFSKVPKGQVRNVVVAYEPIWAVGKSARRDATPEEVKEIAIFIKRVIGDIHKTKSVPPIKILYGGSVTPKNTSEMLTLGGVDGLLVGRASLDPKIFGQILQIANNLNK